jgi:hypothetical protein
VGFSSRWRNHVPHRNLARHLSLVSIKGKIMATATRIYIVGSLDGSIRLVRATTPHQALSHIAHSQFTVRVPTQDELVAAVSKGVTVENYKDASQADLELGEGA